MREDDGDAGFRAYRAAMQRIKDENPSDPFAYVTLGRPGRVRARPQPTLYYFDPFAVQAFWLQMLRNYMGFCYVMSKV